MFADFQAQDNGIGTIATYNDGRLSIEVEDQAELHQDGHADAPSQELVDLERELRARAVKLEGRCSIEEATRRVKILAGDQWEGWEEEV